MGALLAGVFCGVLLQVSIFFLLLIEKIKWRFLRCDREVRLLVPDGLGHDEWEVKRGGGREWG